MKPTDLYIQITDKIIALMSTHGSDWTRPWTTQGTGMPRNLVTDQPYRGINILLLSLEASQKGYGTPTWGTFRQWQTRGGQVRKGEKGTLGVFYKPLSIDNSNEEKTIPVLKHFYLFNAEQVDGVDIKPTAPLPEPQRIDAVESFIAQTHADIPYGGCRAAYSPMKDRIRMPPITAFTGHEPYYATLLHELAHWTGHKMRLDRRQGMESRFGDNAYAMEELVAELSAAFLSIALNITPEPRADHAKYLNNWLALLKGDMRAFSTAASKAQQAADYLSALQSENEAAA